MNVSKYVAIFFFVFIQLISVGKVFANADEWMTTFRENIAQTWQQPEHYDLYIPAITWHARFAYDKEKTDRYNERPWGGGFGQSRWDEKGNWHGLYAMAFKDSWNKWEPIAGYGWESTWRPLADENFHLGLGFTAGVTARDNWNYIPLPVLLPLASVGYGPATFQMTERGILAGRSTPARRPHNSRLNTEKFQQNFALVLPDWQVGVKRMLNELFTTTAI